jgi:hypothetical protein
MAPPSSVAVSSANDASTTFIVPAALKSPAPRAALLVSIEPPSIDSDLVV